VETPASPPNADTNHSLQPPEVVVTDLYKSFGDHHVLQGINLCIRRGELVAIVGASGSGKTVLLKHLTGHFQPDSGTVMLADHESPGSPLRNLAEMTEEELDHVRVHWAVVFQRNALLSGTVYENLALWSREIKRMSESQILPLATQALHDVGLDPERVMSSVREALSGGMAKRLAIARAIVMDPVLIFYDEPTSGLDPEMCATIHELIGRTHRALPALGLPRTSVIVTHDTELLRRLRPRVVMLYQGQVFFDGTFDAFVASTDPHIRPYVEQMPILQAVLRHDE